MNKKLTLLIAITVACSVLHAQKNNKNQKTISGFAITAAEKGGRSWREVKQFDMISGAELKSIYSSQQESTPLNARTGKPIPKKEPQSQSKFSASQTGHFPRNDEKVKKIVHLDDVLQPAQPGMHRQQTYIRVYYPEQQTDNPFSTNSAAMAYDKKHERLYYTPMNINQLRYIDLKSGKIYYFEGEDFGVVKRGGDPSKQITRMVIASDGDGYALTNDGNHLIRFTTGKKPVITDLGALADKEGNSFSIHNRSGFGGDMVADVSGNLYLVTANRNVFKISIDQKIASHLGVISGLPRGFSTNGAMVEEGSKVILASSESTAGYFRFDLETLAAEKISEEGAVYNASDLANGNLAFDKKKKDKNEPENNAINNSQPDVLSRTNQSEQTNLKTGIAVYPNPVTDGRVRLSFSEQPAGKYQVQLLDISGKLITSKEITINSEAQVEEIRFPELSIKGNYLIRVSSEWNKVNSTIKIIVQ